MLLIFNMVWPCVLSFPQSANRHNDMIFWFFVYCPSVTRVQWDICQSANISIWEFIWGHYHVHLGVRLLKKIQDWIFKSERIRKWILRFFTTQIKGTEESTSRPDCSVPFTHHDPKDVGLICLVRKLKIHFRILSIKNPNLDFLKETHP